MYGGVRTTARDFISPQGKILIREGRVLGNKNPVVTLKKYNRYVPNLTREDGKALLAANKMAKRSGPLIKYQVEYQ
jgi:hypothetical protein